ncbi:MAG: hypothetical protein FVQ81_13180 [Candidatus Glassbacteria bacterium]|nr:hypothetical protein [Candidatus Glassbacteria bacterium]
MPRFKVELSLPLSAWAHVKVVAENEEEAKRIALEKARLAQLNFSHFDAFSFSDARVDYIEVDDRRSLRKAP